MNTSEKNLPERLEEAEAAIRDAIVWLKEGGSIDTELLDSAEDAVHKVMRIRRAYD